MSRVEYLQTTCLTDALNSTNYMDIGIKPLIEDWCFVGTVFTVEIEGGENLSVLEAIYKSHPGDVLVIDGKGWTNNAFAGNFIISLAQSKGISGIVADGVIRDIKDSKGLDFPVFCKGTTTAAGKKNKIDTINQNIECGGVAVSPGDIIVGDADGVVVIPKNKEDEVNTVVLKEATQALAKGHIELYDEIIHQAMNYLSSNNKLIVMAQLSTNRALETFDNRYQILVLSASDYCIKSPIKRIQNDKELE